MDKANILMTNGSLMQVKCIAECSKGSILQYFWPAWSRNWSWKPIFGLFDSGGFTQVFLFSLNSVCPNLFEISSNLKNLSSNFQDFTVIVKTVELDFAPFPPPPPLGNFADISYLEENFKPHLLRDVCTLYSGALVSDSLLHMLL